MLIMDMELKIMIDLHCHLIPGVDDGAIDMEDSVELAKSAIKEGIKHIILTPHHRNGQYVNNARDVLQATEELKRHYASLNLPLKVFGAQEIRLTEQFLDDLEQNKLLSLDGRGKYYLIEFPTKKVPKFTEDLIEEIVSRGITPVIAHPERNHELAQDLEFLYELVEMGCLTQLTASSYVGAFGPKLQDICYQMLEHNLVHIIASDAHDVEKRPHNMKRCFSEIHKVYGMDMVRYLQENSRRIFNGEPINKRQPLQFTQPKRKKRFGLF